MKIEPGHVTYVDRDGRAHPALVAFSRKESETLTAEQTGRPEFKDSDLLTLAFIDRNRHAELMRGDVAGALVVLHDVPHQLHPSKPAHFYLLSGEAEADKKTPAGEPDVVKLLQQAARGKKKTS